MNKEEESEVEVKATGKLGVIRRIEGKTAFVWMYNLGEEVDYPLAALRGTGYTILNSRLLTKKDPIPFMTY